MVTPRKNVLRKAVLILFLALAAGASWWTWRLRQTVESAGGDFTQLRPIQSVTAFADARWRDLSGLDLAAKQDVLPTLDFNLATVWPRTERMPSGLKPKTLLTAATNPGLGVRELHHQGITGKGIHVAIIDQPLPGGHPEYAGKIVAYHDVGCHSGGSMHGPAVASLLVGTQCGTAPDARLFFCAAPSWTGDAAYQAKALDWIVERNAGLPVDQKIRVVSVSAAPSGSGSPFKQNTELWDPACQRAEAAGILVLDCTSHHGFIAPSYYDSRDPENVAKVTPGFPGRPVKRVSERLHVPCSPRTTAEEYKQGEFGYQYNGRGGLSWSIPYCAGVLALGWQLRPDLSGPEMRALLFQSAHVREDGAKIIHPKAFIELVKQAPPIQAARVRMVPTP